MLAWSRGGGASVDGDIDCLVDYDLESSLTQAVATLSSHPPLGLVVVATGVLHSALGAPEKSLGQLNAEYLQQQFLVNVIGPMLLLKHLAPHLPLQQPFKLVFLSAKVGSIGDNRLGGWYGYRAAKAALNQVVKTASIELTRRNPDSLCVALHPGTVRTDLSEPYRKAGLAVQEPQAAVAKLLGVVNALRPAQTGQLLNHDGSQLPW